MALAELDPNIASVRSLVALARRSTAQPVDAVAAVDALGRIALGNDRVKLRVAAAGGVEVLFEILRNGENSAHHPRAWIKKLAARALANLGPEVDDGRAMRNEFMVEIPRTEDATSRLDVAEYALQVHELNLYCHLLKLSAEVDAKVSDELEVELLRCVNALYLARAQKVLAEWQEEDAARGSFSSIADGLSEYDGDPGSDGD